MAIKEDKSFTGTQIGCRSFLQGERSWRICFNGSLSVKRIELLYSVVKEHERRKSSFLYIALEKSKSVTNIQNFFLFLYHIGKESVILLSC